MLPSYLFLADINSRALLLRTWKIVAFCRFLPKLQPVWVVGGQLSNWAASLTSSVINRAKSGRFFFVHLQALMQQRECTLKGAVARNGAWGTTPLPLPMSDPTHHTQRLSLPAGASSPSSSPSSSSSPSILIIFNVSPYQQGHAQAARDQGRGCSATTRGNVPPLKSTPVPAPISSTRMSTSTTTADFDSPIVISFWCYRWMHDWQLMK